MRKGLKNDVFNRDWKFGKYDEYAPKFYCIMRSKIKEKRIEIGMNKMDMVNKV